MGESAAAVKLDKGKGRDALSTLALDVRRPESLASAYRASKLTMHCCTAR